MYLSLLLNLILTFLLFCIVFSSMNSLIKADLCGRHAAKITVSTSDSGTEGSTVKTSLLKLEQITKENILLNIWFGTRCDFIFALNERHSVSAA